MWLVSSRWPLLFAALLAIVVPVAWIGYALALHGSGFLLAALVVLLGLPVLPALVGGATLLFSPLPELTVDGIRVRRRLVPWSAIDVVWLEYFGRRLHLSVLTTDPDRKRPYRVPLTAGSPEPAALADAIRTLSHGAVELSDRGPQREASAFDEGGPRRRRSLRLGRETKAPAWRYIVWPVALVLAVPLFLDRPQAWRQPWWPGVTAAAVVPDACAAVSAEVARDLFASATGQHFADSGDHSACRIDGNQAYLAVDISAFSPAFSSGADAAVARMNEARSRTDRFRPEPVSGLGDAAWIAGNPQGTSTGIDRAQVLLVVRRANVVIEIIYRGESEPATARAAVVDTARRALAAAEIA
ncbi:hypothetical protein GCM10009682_50570 [Luedemannella flava]|uniref:DUF304 domain-containing protein n=1 Tax=Luedemannella flava TaxID=349316 RepID=A0ABP4YSE4_9ACTN